MNDEERGLYRKFSVKRLNDKKRKHVGCSYFVLDLNHDPYAAAALRAYADACEAAFPALASDLRRNVRFP